MAAQGHLLRLLVIMASWLLAGCTSTFNPGPLREVKFERGTVELSEVRVNALSGVTTVVELDLEGDWKLRRVALHNGSGSACKSTAFPRELVVDGTKASTADWKPGHGIEVGGQPRKLVARFELIDLGEVAGQAGSELFVDIALEQGEQMRCLRLPVAGEAVRYERTSGTHFVSFPMHISGAMNSSNGLHGIGGFGVGGGRWFGPLRGELVLLGLGFSTCDESVCERQKEALASGYLVRGSAEVGWFEPLWQGNEATSAGLAFGVRYTYGGTQQPTRQGDRWLTLHGPQAVPYYFIGDTTIANANDKPERGPLILVGAPVGILFSETGAAALSFGGELTFAFPL